MVTICRKIKYGSRQFYEAAMLRFQVCCVELGWFDQSSYFNQQEIDEYDKFAEHFGVYDEENRLTGYCRLITGVKEYPIEKYSKKVFCLAGSTKCEVSRLIVDKRYRKNTIAVVLIAGIYEEVLAKNIDYALALIEPKLLVRLNHLGIPFKQFGDTVQDILGADILLPCIVKISEIHMMEVM